MKSIDFKSLLIGILGTLLVIACTGASINIKPKSGTHGTYAISCFGSYDLICVVMDTQSGLIKGKVYSGDIEKNLGLIDVAVLDD